MRPLILYTSKKSPPARAVLMVGNHLGLNFECVEVHEKTPSHSIPMLDDRGFSLCDTHAIATYLISKFGADKRGALYPSDLQIRAVIDSRLFFDTTVLFSRLVTTICDGVNETTTALVEDAYHSLEMLLKKSSHIACDHFTVADICAGATVTSLNALVPVDADKFPRIIEWIKSLYSERCFQEVNAKGVGDFSAAVHLRWNPPPVVEKPHGHHAHAAH